MDKSSVVEELVAVLGATAVSVDPADLQAHSRDAWPVAAKWSDAELNAHLPVCVIRPSNQAAVQAAVRTAVRLGCAITPYGAGSGVTGAAIPRRDAIAIDMRSMAATLHLDTENMMVTVEAGVIGGDLECWLQKQGYTLGHYPQSLYLASVGGLVSTRSTGTFSSKYGGIEDLILGLQAVLPDGSIVKTRATPRSATGPDLTGLFVGAEGSFGILTHVTLRVFRKAETLALCGYSFPSLDSAVKALRSGYGRHIRPAVLRVYDAIEAQGLYGRSGIDLDAPLLIVGHEGDKRIALAEQAAFAELVASFGGRALGEEIGENWAAHRYDASWIAQGNGGPTLMADAIEVAVSWNKMVPLYDKVMAALKPLCAKAMGHYSHFYSTGGCIYFIFFAEGRDTAEVRSKFLAVWKIVMEQVLAVDGTIGHHHGVGMVRADFMRDELGSSYALLERVKHALDPNNTMNPGKFGLPSHNA